MKPFKFKHLFFDLDRTLWDYETNCREVLDDLYDQHLSSLNLFDSESFRHAFHIENKKLWDAFTKNKIDKAHLRKYRFINTLNTFSLDNSALSETLEEQYLEQTPSKTKLLPHADTIIKELSENYTLHILTNGFEDVQNFKLKNIGLHEYFNTVITSDLAGARKPQPEIFSYAMNLAGAEIHQSVMIGDDPHVDILGAEMFGLPYIMYNSTNIPHQLTNPTEVTSLIEIPELLRKMEQERSSETNEDQSSVLSR